MRPLSLLLLVPFLFLATASSVARQPIDRLERVYNASIRTGGHRVAAHSVFDLDLVLGATPFRLSLAPNDDIIPAGATVNIVGADGQITSKPILRHEHKVYRGTARRHGPDGWVAVGTARISIHADGARPVFEGTFSVDGVHHHVLKKTSYVRSRVDEDPHAHDLADDDLVLWRDSDLRKRGTADYMCRAHELEANQHRMAPPTSPWSMSYPQLFGRQVDTTPGAGNTGTVDLRSTIGQTAGCPSARKVALMGVATDCSYSGQFDGDDAVRQNVIDVINQASGVFESAFNISLGLQNLTMMPAACPGSPQAATPWNQACTANLGMQTQLDLFSVWRNTLSDGNSHWTLLTTCREGSAVGLAWVGSACFPPSPGSNNNQTTAGANVVAMTGSEWQVVAHETGHTFGAVHDCDSTACQDANFVNSGQCCPLSATECSANAQYVMNPFSTDSADTFSPCSVGNVCSALLTNSVNSTCLTSNRNIETITGQECGNGIVEGDEQCDCGDAAACAADPCCEGTTCRFTAGSVCQDSNQDCCRNCQFAAAGTVCRASTSECDPEETCPGTAADCPQDVTAPDGQSCVLADAPAHAGDLACASGQCTSRNLQCISVMGRFTNGSNDTYACPTDPSSCTLACGSPAFGANVCYQLQQNLLDGTSCGGDGHCSLGRCEGASFGGQARAWIDGHKGIVIGVAVGVGVLLLAIVAGCCCSCMRRRRRQRPGPRPVPGSGPGPRPGLAGGMGPSMRQQPPPGWYGPAPPPQQQMGGPWSPGPQGPQGQQAWSPGPGQQGQGWRPPPMGAPPPPPAYFGQGNTGSARYA